MARRSLGHCKSIQNGALNPFPSHDCCPLTRPSFQDALKHFFQPTKTGDPRVDFYTMYKRESAEYDTDYVKKYDEDLNTTLIFVRYLSFFWSTTSLNSTGRPVLCRQLGLRNRRPFESPTRSQPTISRTPPSHPPHSQPICHSRRDPHRPARSGRSSERDRNYDVPDVCEPPDIAVGGIHRNAGEAVVEPLPAAFWRVGYRALWRPPAEM